MATELAQAYVSLAIEGSGLTRQVDRELAKTPASADRAGKTAGKRFAGGMGGGFKMLGGLFAGAMAGLAVKDFLGDSLAEARESQKVGALTASIIRSTGGAAKITEGQVGALAGAISAKTGVDDEAIQSGANLLLTFKNVRNEAGLGNDVFNRATASALDLSKAGFGSVSGASKMLGKALNDPIKGISALGRAGVTFTEAQKEQIKQMVKGGDALGAQKIILAEVESQVGGAAAATATAGDKARVTFDNLKEAAGTRLLPIVDQLATRFTTLVSEFQAGTGAGGRIRSVLEALGNVVAFLSRHLTAVKVVLGVVVGGIIAWRVASAALNAVNAVQLALLKAQTVGTIHHAVVSKTVAVATKVWAAGQWLLNAALTANPIGLVIAAIAALVAIVVLAYKKNETFRRIVDAVWAGIKKAISTVVDWFRNTAWPWLRDTFDKIKAGFVVVKDTLGRAWKAIQDAATSAIRTVVSKFLGMVSSIITGAAKAFGWVPGLGGKLKTAAADFAKFKDRVNTALGGVKGKTVTLGVNFKAGTKLAYDARHQGLAAGGLVPRLAAGGLIPGPWRGPTADNVLGISDAGIPVARVNPLEYILPVRSTARIERDHPGALDYMRKTGRLPGYASGGLAVRSRLAGRRDVDGGVDDGVLDVVAKSAKMLQAANSAASGVGIGSKAYGWKALWAIVHRLLPGIQLTSAYRPGAITALGNKSLHGMGRAIDVAPPNMAAFNTILRAFPNATQLFYGPADGRTLLRGKRWNMDPVTKRNHYDHIHLAMSQGGLVPKPLLFDRGGVLPMGTSLVRNATGAPEPLAPVGRVGETHVHLEIDGRELAEIIVDRLTGGARIEQRKIASGRVYG